MVTGSDTGLSTETPYQAARQLPREGRIVLIEMLASSLREDETLDPEVLAEAGGVAGAGASSRCPGLLS